MIAKVEIVNPAGPSRPAGFRREVADIEQPGAARARTARLVPSPPPRAMRCGHQVLRSNSDSLAAFAAIRRDCGCWCSGELRAYHRHYDAKD
jgi:hypothetical protein